MTKVELFNKFLEDSDATITISFLIREAIELKNKTEGVLTTTQYRHVEEFVDMCEDWVNYLNRIERN